MTRRDTIMAQIRRHGLTAVDKAELAGEQDGCAICSRLQPGGKGWVVDHDRSCCAGDQSCLDCRRGVLCQWCNNALGYAQDDPTILRRLADYLELGTRMHPSQVWNRDQLSDQLSDSVDRLASADPTDGENGLTKKSLLSSDETLPCVTRAGGASISAATSLASLGEVPR